MSVAGTAGVANHPSHGTTRALAVRTAALARRTAYARSSTAFSRGARRCASRLAAVRRAQHIAADSAVLNRSQSSVAARRDCRRPVPHAVGLSSLPARVSFSVQSFVHHWSDACTSRAPSCTRQEGTTAVVAGAEVARVHVMRWSHETWVNVSSWTSATAIRTKAMILSMTQPARAVGEPDEDLRACPVACSCVCATAMHRYYYAETRACPLCAQQ